MKTQFATLTFVSVAWVCGVEESPPAYAQAVQDTGEGTSQHRRRSPNTPRDPGRGRGRGGSNHTAALFPLEYRTIDGSENHPHHDAWGAAGEGFVRRLQAAYADGVGAPSGAERANPRDISNAICAQTGSIPNPHGVSDFVWIWGQFLDHDITETPLADPAEAFDIAVPLGDPYFDPTASGTMTIGLHRSSYDLVDGRREQVNAITAFIDGSQVYGSEEERAHALRTLDGTGRLKTSAGDWLPFNVDGLPNAPHNGASLFVAGDIRANEQVLLTAMHTIFVREHNHWAEVIQGLRPTSGEETYQMARAIVVAELQAITYREFLPALLGPGTLPRYEGYRPQARPTIQNLFATAGFRFGHTMLPDALARLEADGSDHADGPLPLAQAFFRPDRLVQDGMETYFRGAAQQVAQDIDPFLVDGVRNFLFGAPGQGGLDLASLNIQRGRDHGLPSFLQVQRALGTHRGGQSWAATAEIGQRIEDAVGDFSQVDPWVGFLSEARRPGSLVGRSLERLLKEQFTALRDGDRFYYEAYLSERLVQLVDSQTLAVILRRNSDLGAELQDNVFLVP